MAPREAVLIAQGVSRKFGYRMVVRDVSLDVAGGDAVLLIGHNGAGKTTLLRLLAGLLKPSAGSVTHTGRFAMVAHHSMLYDALTARENLAFFGKLHGVSDGSQIDTILEQMGLAEFGDMRVAAYSRGMVQRLAIGRALLAEPDVLLLDEPLSGLDDAASRIVRDVLTDLRKRKCAIVIATHQLVELVDLVSSVGFLVKGKLAALEPIGSRSASEVMTRYRELASDA